MRSAFDFEDPNFLHRPYDKMIAYGQSKTANILFAVEADRRYAADGVRAYALHPGAILDTDLARHYDPAELELVIERARRIGSFKTIEQGAATTIFCTTNPLLAGFGGVYCENCDVAAIKSEGDDGVRPYAIDSGGRAAPGCGPSTRSPFTDPDTDCKAGASSAALRCGKRGLRDERRISFFP